MDTLVGTPDPEEPQKPEEPKEQTWNEFAAGYRTDRKAALVSTATTLRAPARTAQKVLANASA